MSRSCSSAGSTPSGSPAYPGASSSRARRTCARRRLGLGLHPVRERRPECPDRDSVVSATLRSTTDLIAAEDAHTSGLYTKRTVVLVRGDGATVFDSEGRAYVDCVGGQGTANLGHGNVAVADAIAQQARTLASCTELFYNDQRAELYEVLAGILPAALDRVFLCNSGAEAVAGGMPMGAIAFSRKVGELTKRSHSSTFGGNPLACAAAIAAIGELRRLDLARNARERGAQLIGGLRAIRSDRIREVRGLGLLVGVELKENAAGALRALQDEGVLALGAGPTVVRFLPPLVISESEIDRVLAASAKALG